MQHSSRHIALALLVGMSIALTHGRAAVGQGVADQPVDFIQIDGAVYLSLAYLDEDIADMSNVPVDAERVGPAVAQVVTNRVDPAGVSADPNEPCTWDSPDRSAPRLLPGDDIYAVRGYASTFRLAARQGESFAGYQIWCSNRAKVGADLFDIFNRVERIEVTGDTSESTGWATIDDVATVNSLVEMMLEGSVISADAMSTAPVSYQLIIYLDDDTSFRASAAEGELLWGLGAVEVPAAFTEELGHAWRTQLAVP